MSLSRVKGVKSRRPSNHKKEKHRIHSAARADVTLWDTARKAEVDLCKSRSSKRTIQDVNHNPGHYRLYVFFRTTKSPLSFNIFFLYPSHSTGRLQTCTSAGAVNESPSSRKPVSIVRSAAEAIQGFKHRFNFWVTKRDACRADEI